ncbi:transposase [Sorangium sp. So ce381]|uniref:transposase n=1 Tax=Sorangium sp. So ce381 TaxID=3133307 RepID=UPI003F5C4D20
MHAATRAGAHHAAAREALLRYVLRPPIANERVEPQQDGLVQLSLKRAFAHGTVAVDMDPLSLLCRLAASVPPPRFPTVKYAGVLASASRPRWRASASDRALPSRRSRSHPFALPRYASSRCDPA